jgi:uncharacterized membrane protein
MTISEQNRGAVAVNNAQERGGLLKTRALVVAVIAGNVLGNTLLSRGLHHRSGGMPSTSPLHYLHAIADPWVIAGVLVLMAWMVSDLALLSRADLSYVLPVTSVSYVLIAIIGHFVLHEHISLLRWVGVVVITTGVTLVGETPPATTPLHPPPEDEL